jgi:hypothetical protein
MTVIIVTPESDPTDIYGVVIVPDHLTAEEAFHAACAEVGDDPAKFTFREKVASPLDSAEPQSFRIGNTKVELPAAEAE